MANAVYILSANTHVVGTILKLLCMCEAFTVHLVDGSMQWLTRYLDLSKLWFIVVKELLYAL